MARLTSVAVTVPDGVGPGEMFKVATAWGFEYDAACPEGSGPGDGITIDIPATPEADAQLLEALQRQTDDEGFTSAVEEYCRQHCHLVAERGRDSSADAVQEFSLQTQEVHRGYVELVERLLEEHIVAGLGLSIEDFVGCVQRSTPACRLELQTSSNLLLFCSRIRLPYRLTAGVEGMGAGSWLLMTVESLADFDTFTAMMNEMREEAAG